ncbi:hypothetical protein [Roseateles puraquae]
MRIDDVCETFPPEKKRAGARACLRVPDRVSLPSRDSPGHFMLLAP